MKRAIFLGRTLCCKVKIIDVAKTSTYSFKQGIDRENLSSKYQSCVGRQFFLMAKLFVGNGGSFVRRDGWFAAKH